jgi:hypothetical protein
MRFHSRTSFFSRDHFRISPARRICLLYRERDQSPTVSLALSKRIALLRIGNATELNLWSEYYDVVFRFESMIPQLCVCRFGIESDFWPADDLIRNAFVKLDVGRAEDNRKGV